MEIRYGDILDVKKGVIVQQVNCRNAYGAGISGTIASKYPIVEYDYTASFDVVTPNELFGTYREIQVSPELTVINSYTQMNYGNAAKTGIVYTDMDKLAENLKTIAAKYANVYIPYRIGCGLAGGDWNELCKKIKNLPITVVKLT